MPSVLIIEDDADIRSLLRLHAEKAGFSVEEAESGAAAHKRLQTKHFDLCLVDWMLPEMSGLEVIRSLRKSGDQVGIIMVTAKSAPADLVQALEAGADDYMTKPFESDVLRARMMAVYRRAQKKGVATQIALGSLKINTATHDVYCDSVRVNLTKSEFRLLEALIEQRGRVLTRTQLIDLVQGSDISVVDRAIDTHVFGLRKKLGECSDWIETIRGVGYRVRPE